MPSSSYQVTIGYDLAASQGRQMPIFVGFLPMSEPEVDVCDQPLATPDLMRACTPALSGSSKSGRSRKRT
jgi:hypothetical protein